MWWPSLELRCVVSPRILLMNSFIKGLFQDACIVQSTEIMGCEDVYQDKTVFAFKELMAS